MLILIHHNLCQLIEPGGRSDQPVIASERSERGNLIQKYIRIVQFLRRALLYERACIPGRCLF